MCSSVAQTCLTPHTFPNSYGDSYDCLMDGYVKSIEKMEEILSPVIHNYGYDLPSERPFVELSDRQIEENIPRHWSGKELS